MVTLNGTPLASAVIADLARRRTPWTLAPEAVGRAAASSALAKRTSVERAVYGRSTGVGGNRSVRLPDPEGFALDLLRTHATSAGPPRSPERVRAMLVVRLNQLAAGGSGVDPDLLGALAAMIEADALPEVLEDSGIGTGDLAALARTALALQGEVPTSLPVPVAHSFSTHSALPFVSSNAATIGDSALVTDEAERLARACLAVSALTFRAVRGNLEAFAPVVEQVSPFPGVRYVCTAMRALLDDLTGAEPSRVQDPFALRTLPQVNGAFADRVGQLDQVVSSMSAATAENPVFLVGEDGGGDRIAHHGGFHATYLAGALDSLRSALAQSAQLSTARLAMLVDQRLTGLASFLATRTGGSGVMALEFTAAAALAPIRAAAGPVAVQTAYISGGAEDDASYAPLGARQAAQGLEDYRTVLACELVAARRALALHEIDATGPAGELSPDVSERDLSADVALARTLLDDLAQTVRRPAYPHG